METLLPVHCAQIADLPQDLSKGIGLLINFNVPVLLHGLKRIANITKIRLCVSASLRRKAPPPRKTLMLQRFLDPATLASIDGLDLVAKTLSMVS